jgi:hypothetical protein
MIHIHAEMAEDFSSSITFDTGAGEMLLRVAKDGFYVRGIKLEQDENEALKVYDSFCQWLEWAQLNKS